jgi:hypothetical protein
MVASAEEATACRTLLSDTIDFTVTKTDVPVEKAMLVDILSRVQQIHERVQRPRSRSLPPFSPKRTLVSINVTFSETPSEDRVERARANLEPYLLSRLKPIRADEHSPKTVRFLLENPHQLNAQAHGYIDMIEILATALDDPIESLSITTKG